MSLRTREQLNTELAIALKKNDTEALEDLRRQVNSWVIPDDELVAFNDLFAVLIDITRLLTV